METRVVILAGECAHVGEACPFWADIDGLGTGYCRRMLGRPDARTYLCNRRPSSCPLGPGAHVWRLETEQGDGR